MRIARVFVQLVLLVGIGSVASVRTAAAQQTTMGMSMPGMDLSHAPKDIQAIWKKLQSGGVPTPAEAKRLGEWMQAHASDMQQSMTAQVEQQAGGGLQISVGGVTGGGTQAACPTRSSAMAHLGAAAPTRRSALALLDTIRAAYAKLEKPATVQGVQRALARETVPALRQRGALSLLGGSDAVTVLAYVEAVRRATGTDVQGAWGDLGAALVELRDAAHAVPVLRYALTLGPRSPLIVHNLGVAYADLGDLTTASTLLTEVTQAAPHFAGAYDALAKVESCAGHMTVAWHAMAQAQDADWTSDREKTLDRHDTPSTQGSDAQDGDDAAEAAKPFPTPHGPSAFPPPPAARGASSFQPATPVLPDTWREAATRTASYLSQANQYSAAAQSAMQRGMQDRSGAQAEEAIEAATADAAAHGMHVVMVSLTNGHAATDAADLVTRRAGARLGMIKGAFDEQWLQVIKEERAGEVPLHAQLTSCEKAHPNAPPEVCGRPYCKAMNALWDQTYANGRAAARVAIGGYAGTASELHRVMMTWFAWAGDPGSRVSIDADRMRWLAVLQQHAFLAAYYIADFASSWRDTQCGNDAGGQSSGAAEATTDSPNDPGSCAKTSVNLLVIKVERNCETFVLELKPLIVEGVPEGKLEYHAASADRNGTLFMGLSAGTGPTVGPKDVDVLEGHVGMGLTFDQSGLVHAAGPAAGGSLGLDMLTGHVSGTGMINLRDDGPAAAGWGEAEAPSWAAAPHFGGKM